jgi:hypothetical protein
VLGYLAETAADRGCSLQRAQQLQAAAGLAGSAAADTLLWRLVAGISSNRAAALLHLKKTVLADVECSYGQLKVAAALLVLQAVPGAAAGGFGSQGQPELQVAPPTQQVHWSPAVERLLQQPCSVAVELWSLTQEGVPLGVLGQMHGSNIAVSVVRQTLRVADCVAAAWRHCVQRPDAML